MAINKKSFYSTTEVADICNVHRNTIILAIKKGDLRASSTPGGHNRVAHKDLVSFIRERDLPVISIPGEDEGDERRQRILVVDDDKLILKTVEKALADKYEVKVASTGYEAGLLTISFNPDLIVLDMLLPDIDGGEVYRTLRSNEATKSVRVLVVTAVTDERKIAETFGSVPFLKKPFSIENLRRKVNQVLTGQMVGQ